MQKHLGADGSIEYISTIIRDLAERERAEQQRLDFFKEFLGNVSHDLKTPLTIINNSHYLLPRLDSPEKQQSQIDLIKGQVSLLDKYIQDLLTLSQLDNLPEISLLPLDLNLMLKDLQAHLNSIARARNISIQLKLDAALPLTHGDQQALYRALTNLVENATNYTPAGGSVTLRTFTDDSNVVVQVSDTGIGIRPEELPHIFERFYRSKEAQQVRSGGTGLGLAIVKRIIDIHNGRIEVESTPGAGTAFRIWLPAASKSA